MIRLEVIGIPAPQGSKTRMPNGAMLDGTSSTGRAKLIEWRRAVADAGRSWLTGFPQAPLDGPIAVALHFSFPQVKSNPYRFWHATKPDLDKLIRATCDAIKSAGLIIDDSQICRIVATKAYCDHDQPPGCEVQIFDLAEEEANKHKHRKLAAAQRRKAS